MGYLFHDYIEWTWIAVLGYTVFGIAVSFSLKVYSSLVKIMCSSAGMIITNILTWTWLQKEGHVWIYLGLSIVTVSIYVFGYGSYLQTDKEKHSDSELTSHELSSHLEMKQSKNDTLS